MRYLVILDSGHGIDTQGKRTPIFEDGTFMRENEFNRAVIRKIDSMLEMYDDIDVVFISQEKRDVSLSDRVVRANNLFDRYKEIYKNIVLISIHCNAFGDGNTFNNANGTSTHYYKSNIEDKEFAKIIHDNLIKATKPSSDRGIIGSDFMILREVKMKAVLCENLFMTNLENAKALLTNEFREKTALGIVNGIKEYFNIIDKPYIPPTDIKVDYTLTANGTYQLRGDIKDFGVKVVNKNINQITELNCTNGTFYWWEDSEKTKTYPTSILIREGTVIQNTAMHYYSFGCPQSVFIVYNNGRVEMKQVYLASELDYKNIKAAIGGIGLRDTTNQSFKYDPAAEGFKKGKHLQTGLTVDYTNVLKKTNKTVIGYNIRENKLYLMCRENIYHKNLFGYDLLKLVKDCEYDIALSVDVGGSVFMKRNGKIVLTGDNKQINNIMGFGI